MNAHLKKTIELVIKKFKDKGYLNKSVDSSIETMGDLREFIDSINAEGRHYFFDLHEHIANAYVCLIRVWSANGNNYCEINDLLNHQLVGTPNMIYEDDMTVSAYVNSYAKAYATEDEIVALNERVTALEGEQKIYGIRFLGSGTSGTRLNSAANLTFSLSDGVNDFESEELFAQIKRVSTPAYNSSGVALGIDHKFVFFPNFYFKETIALDANNNDIVSWYVSDKPIGGFEPIFKNADGTIPKGFLVGAYESALMDDTEAVVGSFTGKKPACNVNRDWMKARTAYVLDPSLGINSLQEVDQSFPKKAWDAIAILISIVTGTRHHQSVFHGITSDGTYNPAHADNVAYQESGATNKVVIPSNNYIVTNSSVGSVITIFSSSSVGHRWEEHTITAKEADTPSSGLTTLTFDGTAKIMNSGTVRIALHAGELTGKTDSILGDFGNLATNDLKAFKVFGIENFYGNFWTILGGAAIKEVWDATEGAAHNYLMLPDGDNYTPGASYTTFSATETELALNDGYVKRMEFNGSVMVPSVTSGASSSTYYADYYYQDHKSSAGDPAYRTFLAGGSFHIAGAAGSFSFACYYGWTASAYYYGFRSFVLIQ